MKNLTNIPLAIKKIIAQGPLEVRQLLQNSETISDPIRKILSCEPLNAENIDKICGRELALLYIEICNEVDCLKIDDELKSYLIER